MNQTVPVTETVEFICVGQGYGIVNVSWYRGRNNTQPPAMSNVINIVTPNFINSTLTIPNLRDRDSGGYRCRYSNNGGRTFTNFATLTIESK